MVLIHGFGFNASVWQPLAEQFAGDYTIQHINLPGYDDRPKQSELLDPELLAADTDAHWVAWSMGGLVALNAIRHGYIPKTLAFVASLPCMVTRADWPKAIRKEVLDDFRERLQQNVDKAMRHFALLVAHGDARAKTIRSHLQDMTLPEKDVLEQGLDVLEQTDLRTVWAEALLPRMSILGQHDLLVPAEAKEALEHLCPHTRISVMDDCGHAPFLSQPQACAELLREFHESAS